MATLICLDCGHKTSIDDENLADELLALDVVHTPCYRSDTTNKGRMVITGKVRVW